jgi:hypothetical protein
VKNSRIFRRNNRLNNAGYLSNEEEKNAIARSKNIRR